MSGSDLLPDDLVWTREGHLTEVAMTAIADGEDAIFPREAFGHLGSCEACAHGVESAALLSARVSRALGAERERSARSGFPLLAVGVALVAAALAALPGLVAARIWLLDLRWLFKQEGALVARSMAALLPSAWAWAPVASLAAAAGLLLVGVSVTRLAPRVAQRRGLT